MSAYIVKDSTINGIVGWIYAKCQHDRYPNYGWSIKRVLEAKGYRPTDRNGCKRIAEEMFTLNCDAVEQRYGEGEAKKFRDLDFQFSLAGSDSPAPWWIKRTQCWLYQCSEGDVDQNPLYAAIDELIKLVALRYVETLEQYDKAPWE